MKVYNINGELEVQDDLTHQEMLTKLFAILKAYGFHFSGTIEDITEQDIHNVNE